MLINHDISNVEYPHTFKPIKILLRKDNELLIQKTQYYPNYPNPIRKFAKFLFHEPMK